LVQDALPTQGFYAAYYAELHRRCPTYEDFPEEWREQKIASAQSLASAMNPESRVLAYGCGSGFVERCLIDHHGFRDLWLFDQVDGFSRYLPEASARKWNPKTNHGHVNTPLFDAVYLVQVLYALADAEVIQMCCEVQSWLKPGGLVASLDTSLNPPENGGPSTDGRRLPPTQRIVAKAGSALWLRLEAHCSTPGDGSARARIRLGYKDGVGSAIMTALRIYSGAQD